MGISASQARLLTITARLTSNEYESQQISNAKMRLASKSEQASHDYLMALNTHKLQFMTYDAQGAAITEDLTANAIYQFAELKNQYMLVNSGGQALVGYADVKNFRIANNLDEFLEAYGIEKVYKTTTLGESASSLQAKNSYYIAWEAAVENIKNQPGNDLIYEEDKYNAKEAYDIAQAEYADAMNKSNSGMVLPISNYLNNLIEAKQKYADCITYDQWAMSKAAYTYDDSGKKVETQVYKNVQEYYEALSEFLAEAEDLGCTTVEDTYSYSDETKAQWYTNLWYRMNGESSFKSVAGEKETNFISIEGHLANSNTWLQDSLSQGIISIEMVSNDNTSNELSTELISDKFKNKDSVFNLIGNPLNLKLKGISWNVKEYSTCSEFVEKDDDVAVARAEAEYARKNNEITAKDKRYESKIKKLDTEHNSLQTEYESVKSAMNKNIERSYNTFNG